MEQMAPNTSRQISIRLLTCSIEPILNGPPDRRSYWPVQERSKANSEIGNVNIRLLVLQNHRQMGGNRPTAHP